MSIISFLRFFISFVGLVLLLNSAAFSQCQGAYFKPDKIKLFSERVSFESLIVRDLTGDGKPDLIGYDYTTGSSGTTKVLILPNDGQGGFNSPFREINVPLSLASGGIIVADYDGDGDNDLVFSTFSETNSAAVYRNSGNGTFTALSTTTLAVGELVLNAVDITNDGFSDLLTLTNLPNQNLKFYYRSGTANGTFGSPSETPAALYSIAGDFNNDGKIDFPVVSGSSPNYQLKIYYNQGNGAFALGSQAINLGASYPAFAREFNNDGKIDLLVTNYPNAISIIRNLGDGNFSKTDYPLPPITTSGLSYGVPQTGDYNGDGFLDFMTFSEAQPFYSIYTNNGAGNFTRRDYSRPAGGVPFGDLDGDLKTDLIGFDIDYGQSDGFRLFNESRLIVRKNVCVSPGQTKFADFDRDQITDKLLWRAAEGRWSYHQSLSPSPFSTFFWGASSDIPAAGDYDRDGITDFAVYRPSEGVWYIRKSSDGAYLSVRFGASEDQPVAADYDGDGQTDIAVYRPSTGGWYILRSSDGQIASVQFGAAEDKPLPEDYDGDGKSDVAVFRPSNGYWYLLKSTNGSFSAFQWGSGTDKPVPADYDGDGKADLAVFRNSEGNWYILRSYNLQMSGFHFGAPGDIPQPGDWDGNGATNLGVYRPNTGNWYSSHTNNQFTFGSALDNPKSYLLTF